jgi:hypothetical protein
MLHGPLNVTFHPILCLQNDPASRNGPCLVAFGDVFRLYMPPFRVNCEKRKKPRLNFTLKCINIIYKIHIKHAKSDISYRNTILWQRS